MILEQGTTYYFQILNNSEFGGIVGFDIKEDIPPANDDFINATMIPTIPYSDSVDMLYTSTEAGEPNPCDYSAEKTIWYAFIPDTSGLYTSEVAGEGSVRQAVYTGQDLAELVNIGCTIDWAPITMMLEGGTTYYYQVFTNSYGRLVTINLIKSVPANDNFVDATKISELPFTGSVDTKYATIEPDEVWGCNWTGSNTVWYSFTPDSDGSYTAESTGGYYIWPTITVFQGSNFNDLQVVGCVNNFYTAQATFHLNANTTYFYQTYATDWQGNGVRLDFNLYSTPPTEAYFSFWPGDPMKNESIQFNNDSLRPGWGRLPILRLGLRGWQHIVRMLPHPPVYSRRRLYRPAFCHNDGWTNCIDHKYCFCPHP